MILVDASTFVALGQIGELGLLCSFDRAIILLPEVHAEVTSEPAATNLTEFTSCESVVVVDSTTISTAENAAALLGESERNGDVAIIGLVMCGSEDANQKAWLEGQSGHGRTVGDEGAQSIAVISDDRRVRTVGRSLGATVTGTIGVIVRAVEERGMSVEEGKDLVRRVDSHGLHMTGELRENAYELVEEAATD
jgi:predicted nucleic acid-binding protein